MSGPRSNARQREQRHEREYAALTARMTPEIKTAVKDVLDRPDPDNKLGQRLVKRLRLAADRADAGRVGGIMAGRSMTAQQRINRAHLGGLAVFYRGGSATGYAKLLADKKRRRRRSNVVN